MKDSRKKRYSAAKTVELAALVAIIAVLHFAGTFFPIKMLGTTISLVLIPIVVGGMLFGAKSGAFLGFAYGLLVYFTLGVGHLDVFTGYLFDASPIATFLICTVKSTLAGWLGGVVYGALKNKNRVLAVFAASAIVPTVNTGVFVIGCLMIGGTISGFVSASALSVSPVYFITVMCAGMNYLVELAVNLIFAPAVHRIVKAVGAGKK